MIHLDGSKGEGGGQILRTALTLSLVTGSPFRLEKVRAGRPRPGLLRQHLVAVEAAATIGAAEVEGATLGSQALTFTPSGVCPGRHRFAIGSAGSAVLVLQTVLPALLHASGPSTIVVEGGTHNPLAPPFEFFERTYLPLLRRMGAQIEAVLERAGFYPAGGGAIRLEITPSGPLKPLALLERGPMRATRASAIVANLPTAIARRENAVLCEMLGWAISTAQEQRMGPTSGRGNIVLAEVESDALCEVFSAVGEHGVCAEAVAARLAREVRTYLEQDAPVGPHLADQLVLLLALAGSGVFRTMTPTAHTRTQLSVIGPFLGREPAMIDEVGGTVRIEV